jgi:hypothetical protein
VPFHWGVGIAQHGGPGHARRESDTWALRKAADLLSSFSSEKKLEILEAPMISNHQRQIMENHGTSGERQEQNVSENQHQINLPKAYVCCIWPSLSIGGKVGFRNGLFQTNDSEVQRLVEKAHGFGVHILEVTE